MKNRLRRTKLENLLRLQKKVSEQENGKKPVKIPNVLIERLKPFGPRFIKVEQPRFNEKQSGKAAIEKEWQKHPYEASDPELQEWLAIGGNYGIMAGQGLIFIETDNETTNKKLQKRTFSSKSGSERGFHRLYRSDITENGVLINPKTGENLGNIQVNNKYVVGPNCHHYTGGTYKIVDDGSIEWISKKEIEEIFGEMLSWTGQRRKEIEQETKEEQEQLGFTIPLKNLIDINGMHQLANDEYQGAHPLHGSETGQNFCVNLEKNLWHCFRCNSGGGGLMWIAVKNGIIKCHEARKGALKGENFGKTLKAAKEEGFEIKGLFDDDLNPDIERFYDVDKKTEARIFRAAFVAKELMKEHIYITRESDELTFRYEPKKGIYELYGEAHIKNQTRIKLGKHTSKTRQGEVVNFIKVSTYKELQDAPLNLIVVKNGVLNLDTMKLEPHNPEYFIFNRFNAEYNPKADCPKFKKFLNEVVKEGDIETIQEFVGFCLHREYTFHKTLLLVGEGANGKSTFLETLRALLGNENVANESLQVLQNNRFALSQLYGKLANIYADLPAIALRDTGHFKMLTGNDTISGEYKFKDRFNFKNYAKLIFSCNKIPETPDDTTAFYRRWLIINFPNQFLDNNKKTDKNLINKLTSPEELSGILNWAIEGLKRLLKAKQFTTSKTVEETRQQYVESSDPIRAFAEECLSPEPNSVVTKDDVYQAYIKYCDTRNLPATTKNSFAMRLVKYVPASPTKTKRLGKDVNAWRGIILATEATEATAVFLLSVEGGRGGGGDKLNRKIAVASVASERSKEEEGKIDGNNVEGGDVEEWSGG